MPTISVIIPIYKVEPYLRRCVDSVLQQTFSDFEVILVDDGSPDNCPQICDEYAALDSRVRVIHQKNGGLSAARNAGMKIANGEYYTFIDSDDYVSPVFLECLWENLKKHHADISACAMQIFDETVLPENNHDLSHQNITTYSGVDYCRSMYLLQTQNRPGVSADGKLYCRTIFESLQFPEGKAYEDQGTTPIAVHRANCVVCSDFQGYFYYFRQGSISHQKRFNINVFDNVFCLEHCITYYDEVDDEVTASTARKMKQVCQARSVINARLNHAGKLIPRQYADMGTIEALKIIYGRCYFRHYLAYIIRKNRVLYVPAKALEGLYKRARKEN